MEENTLKRKRQNISTLCRKMQVMGVDEMLLPQAQTITIKEKSLA